MWTRKRSGVRPRAYGGWPRFRGGRPLSLVHRWAEPNVNENIHSKSVWICCIERQSPPLSDARELARLPSPSVQIQPSQKPQHPHSLRRSLELPPCLTDIFTTSKIDQERLEGTSCGTLSRKRPRDGRGHPLPGFLLW